MIRPILGATALMIALIGGAIYGTSRALLDETWPDLSDDDG